MESSSEQESSIQCIICCEPIEFFAVGACNHVDVCAICTYKLRVLEDKGIECVICKNENKIVVVDESDETDFENYALQDLVHDTTTKFFFVDKEIMGEFHRKILPCCRVCNFRTFPNIVQLNKHLKHEHG